jgi:LuxR family transcriptional regulator, maltose regulon positive regulatory protein
MLRSHLLAEAPERVPELHRRASEWFAAGGDSVRAVDHALAAGDPERAADLVELAFPQLRRARQEGLIRAWAQVLPTEVVAHRPVLAIELVGGLMASNAFEGVEERLQDIERQMTLSPDEITVVDRQEYQRIPASLETFRAGLALVSGELRATIDHADRALALAGTGDDLTVGAAAALSGLASWAMGDVSTARTAYTVSIGGLIRAGHIADVLGCSLAVADIDLTLGRLSLAEQALHRGLALADEHRTDETRPLRGTADMYVGLSRAAWHRNDLALAAAYLGRADELGESAGLPQHPYRWRVALARLRVADGDPAGALELLDEAERVYVTDFSPPVHPIHATRARVRIGMGDLAFGRAWADEQRLTVDDEVTYLLEYQHVTLARLLLADGTAQSCRSAIELLDRLLAAAEGSGRGGSVMEIETVRALAAHQVGQEDLALRALEHAVELAEADGRVRLFIDAGKGIADLIAELARRVPSEYRVGLATQTGSVGAGAPPTVSATPPARPSSQLVDPLSERELEVLRLLASDLDGPDIARQLVVSLNTVRTHTKHIYTKLGVNSRRAAVSRAHQLALLSRVGL